MINTTFPRPAGMALAACVILSTPTALAHDGEHAALEARIAQLEALVAELTGSVPAEEATDEAPADNGFEFGGYVKLDAMFSRYSDGDLAAGSAGSQFYIPAAIPVGDAGSEGPDLDMQGRETRIYASSDHELSNGDRIASHLEIDFFVSPGGDERVSNSFNPRLRHAWFRYNDWLFGQTWSTFQDVAALPENLDFIGPAESTTFVRQAQVRYRYGPWEFALENPETTITPFGGGDHVTSDDGGLPDFVTRFTHTWHDGHVRAALLFRELRCTEIGVDDGVAGWGLSVSGKHEFGDDDLRWMATVGRGTGRYLGLNTADDAVLDAGGALHAIDQWGAFVSLRHFWSARWRSNLTLGYLDNDHDTALTGDAVTDEVYSVHLNLLYDPVPRMTIGGEIMFAERTLASAESGNLARALFSAKYAF